MGRDLRRSRPCGRVGGRDPRRRVSFSKSARSRPAQTGVLFEIGPVATRADGCPFRNRPGRDPRRRVSFSSRCGRDLLAPRAEPAGWGRDSSRAPERSADAGRDPARSGGSRGRSRSRPPAAPVRHPAPPAQTPLVAPDSAAIAAATSPATSSPVSLSMSPGGSLRRNRSRRSFIRTMYGSRSSLRRFVFPSSSPR